MPNGSCCPKKNYCESSVQGKQCCDDTQICDGISGCVEKSLDALCAEAGGTITSGGFCQSNTVMEWEKAKNWCLTYEMELISVYDACPNFDSTLDRDNNGSSEWNEWAGKETCGSSKAAWGWTMTKAPSPYDKEGYYLYVHTDADTVSYGIQGECTEYGICFSAVCK